MRNELVVKGMRAERMRTEGGDRRKRQQQVQLEQIVLGTGGTNRKT